MVGTASLALLGLLPALGRAGIAPALYGFLTMESAASPLPFPAPLSTCDALSEARTPKIMNLCVKMDFGSFLTIDAPSSRGHPGHLLLLGNEPGGCNQSLFVVTTNGTFLDLSDCGDSIDSLSDSVIAAKYACSCTWDRALYELMLFYALIPDRRKLGYPVLPGRLGR